VASAAIIHDQRGFRSSTLILKYGQNIRNGAEAADGCFLWLLVAVVAVVRDRDRHRIHDDTESSRLGISLSKRGI
jgi:hypothetical protein